MSSQKDVHEMSRPDLVEAATKIGGLVPPPRGAPRSHFFAWVVASFFIYFCKDVDASHTDAAKMKAARFLLDGFADRRDEILPHIEQALGKPLPASLR